MTINRFAKSAAIKQVLVYYDGPQLVLLESDRGYPMLAVSVERPDFGYAMFAAEIVGNQLEKYLQGKADLNFVFRSATVRRLYFFDLSREAQAHVTLVRATSAEAENEDYYPLPGIFARSHTHPLQEEATKGEGTQRFLIDGKWEATDFSGFYGKIADTYALMYVSRGLGAVSATEVDKIFLRDSILEKNWQGGGSYASFYGGMRGRARTRHPLRVSGIEYHSPGYIEVVGNTAVLLGVNDSVNSVIKDHAQISKVYKAVYRALKQDGLLRADKGKSFSTDAAEAYTLKQASRLAGMVGLHNVSFILEACENNVVVFAKVVLSFSRRIRDLARFYVEGRVKAG